LVFEPPEPPFWLAARLDGELAALKGRPWWRRLAD
jgi:hypothetical protein